MVRPGKPTARAAGWPDRLLAPPGNLRCGFARFSQRPVDTYQTAFPSQRRKGFIGTKADIFSCDRYAQHLAHRTRLDALGLRECFYPALERCRVKCGRIGKYAARLPQEVRRRWFPDVLVERLFLVRHPIVG